MCLSSVSLSVFLVLLLPFLSVSPNAYLSSFCALDQRMLCCHRHDARMMLLCRFVACSLATSYFVANSLDCWLACFLDAQLKVKCESVIRSLNSSVNPLNLPRTLQTNCIPSFPSLFLCPFQYKLNDEVQCSSSSVVSGNLIFFSFCWKQGRLCIQTLFVSEWSCEYEYEYEWWYECNPNSFQSECSSQIFHHGAIHVHSRDWHWHWY